jgi:hypothetical protein
LNEVFCFNSVFFLFYAGAVTMRQMSKTRSLPIAPHDPYAAFRFSNYRYYTLGSFFSVIGQQMIRVAVGYEI